MRDRTDATEPATSATASRRPHPGNGTTRLRAAAQEVRQRRSWRTYDRGQRSNAVGRPLPTAECGRWTVISSTDGPPWVFQSLGLILENWSGIN